jgi:glycosyltransferase involved in cell wall biosynthesis
MRFTIVTPSYGQLDWLGLCIASVADQQGVGFIEHIVQDAGTPGIEEFARRLGADFYQDGKKVFSAQCASWSPRRPVSSNLGSVDGQLSQSYSLTIYSEKDAGMYDAVNKGLRKSTGEICAYLNCDEQYLPGALCWVGEFFEKSQKAEVLFGDVIVVSAQGDALCHRQVTMPNPWCVAVSKNLPVFTAATFFRRELVSKGYLFPEQWKDLGDAVWISTLINRGVHCRTTRRFLSTFTDTGENMNMRPNALAEKERLKKSAPFIAKTFAVVLISLHRLRRLFEGAYCRKNLSYEIWCANETAHRKKFAVSAVGFSWR